MRYLQADRSNTCWFLCLCNGLCAWHDERWVTNVVIRDSNQYSNTTSQSVQKLVLIHDHSVHNVLINTVRQVRLTWAQLPLHLLSSWKRLWRLRYAINSNLSGLPSKFSNENPYVNNKIFTGRKLSRFLWIFSKLQKFSLLNFCSAESWHHEKFWNIRGNIP